MLTCEQQFWICDYYRQWYTILYIQLYCSIEARYYTGFLAVDRDGYNFSFTTVSFPFLCITKMKRQEIQNSRSHKNCNFNSIHIHWRLIADLNPRIPTLDVSFNLEKTCIYSSTKSLKLTVIPFSKPAFTFCAQIK